MSSVANRIMRRVRGHGRGKWVCMPGDFLDLGSRAAVDQALSRLVRRGALPRAGRGVYVLPVESRFGRRAPSVDKTVEGTLRPATRWGPGTRDRLPRRKTKPLIPPKPCMGRCVPW